MSVFFYAVFNLERRKGRTAQEAPAAAADTNPSDAAHPSAPEQIRLTKVEHHDG
ncbi:hypothetical protein AB0I81_29780 [Nonomuraea sp. NPDC050404]|uniref:hypothetical protein n=1 Tax=Nonomuraea sp. NPDC050404 TaxID=3155783 RepID=UPI0033C979DC